MVFWLTLVLQRITRKTLLLNVCMVMFIFSIDATDYNCLGKLVNDSPNRYANARMKRFSVGYSIHICLFASKDYTSRNRNQVSVVNVKRRHCKKTIKVWKQETLVFQWSLVFLSF